MSFDHVERLVNEEVARFKKEPLSRAENQLNTLADFLHNKGRKHLPYLSYVAQQVIGHQASAAQLERDFSAAGRLLPRRRSRVDTT